jgi:ubiquinone/menaquinone biosynthesis C-methylase UbiE
MDQQTPWQLKMFQKTLKKKLRLKALKQHIGRLSTDDKCLLVTCGDNNGAMNYHLREIGGKWSWADLETKSIKEMTELLKNPVLHVASESLPYPDNQFHCVVSIDVHEHLKKADPFTRELCRITRPGGKIIVTVPNGDETKVATRIKNVIGMTKEKYGHVREGYDIPDLKEHLTANGIIPYAASSFSRFFTELLELSINFLYVTVLSKKSKAKVETGTIAPATQDQLKSIEKTYKIYSFIYPFFWLISKLDALFLGSTGYVVVVSGKKE